MSQIVYLNGKFLPIEQAFVPVLDRGFIFGDGIYEVIPVYSHRPFRLNEHLLLPGFFTFQSNFGFLRRRRPLRKLQFLCRRPGRRTQPVKSQKGEDGGKQHKAAAIRPRC